MKFRTIVLAATMLAGTASMGTAVAQEKKEVPAYKVLDLPKVDLKKFKKINKVRISFSTVLP
ncbi:hypothetical protein OKW96_09340 [Sphingobacterium sp. KU25419]|nr:hypothetical protein OKW96_09340 [Sphingobacterium sp. KU25419]